MNLLKSPFRRTTAVLAGAFIGLAGAVALAAPASAHTPSVDGTTTCVKDGSWTIDWSVGNDFETDATVKRITLLPTDATITGPITEQDVTIPANSAGNPSAQVHGSTTVSEEVTFVTLGVALRWSDGYVAREHKTVKKPDVCPPPSTPPSSPPASDEPTPILKMDCTTMTIGLANPEAGKDITLHFKTSKGEERTDVIKPGESKTETFSATPGFTVTLTADGIEGSETVAYEQPDNCDNSGGGGGLPVTGAAAGTIAGGAAVLLISGAVLFFLARRRKVKFTA